MRILIVKLGSIGDIVHTLPSLAAIRRALPSAEISWVVEARSSGILKDNPMIDNLIEVDTHKLRRRDIDKILQEAGRQFRELRRYEFDLTLDFQGLFKSATIAKLSGAKRRWGFSLSGLREPASRILLTNTVDTDPRMHVIKKNLALASRALDIAAPVSDFEFPIASTIEHIAEAEKTIERCEGSDFVLLNPGGGWVTKLWHAEKFGQLADRLWEENDLRSIVTTGPNEDELAERVASKTRAKMPVFAQPSLKGFYELAKRARVYVGGDTGPTHIAIAARTPIVGLFGPTEWWRNGSPNPEDICVERTDIECRVDCHRRECAKWICMDSDVETVFNAVKKRLANR